jgi:hypothetical protein
MDGKSEDPSLAHAPQGATEPLLFSLFSATNEKREWTTSVTLLVSRLCTAEESPPYCASPHVTTRPVLVSAANANPFLGWYVGELRMDSRCWRFTVGCVEGTLLGWDVG